MTASRRDCGSAVNPSADWPVYETRHSTCPAVAVLLKTIRCRKRRKQRTARENWEPHDEAVRPDRKGRNMMIMI